MKTIVLDKVLNFQFIYTNHPSLPQSWTLLCFYSDSLFSEVQTNFGKPCSARTLSDSTVPHSAKSRYNLMFNPPSNNVLT
jgi:hypothetical protein